MSWDTWCSNFLMRSSFTGSAGSATVERTGRTLSWSGCATGSVIASEAIRCRNWVSNSSMRGVVRGTSPLTCNRNFNLFLFLFSLWAFSSSRDPTMGVLHYNAAGFTNEKTRWILDHLVQWMCEMNYLERDQIHQLSLSWYKSTNLHNIQQFSGQWESTLYNNYSTAGGHSGSIISAVTSKQDGAKLLSLSNTSSNITLSFFCQHSQNLSGQALK